MSDKPPRDSFEIADDYRNYEIERITDDGEPYWTGRVVDLPGCTSDGATVDELMENLREAKALWIQVALEKGIPIPPPSSVTRNDI